MDHLLLVNTFVALVVSFLLGALAHKLLSERTTSPPIPPSPKDCEVFLSCQDTARKGFAGRLYRSLVGVGIRVFGDHDEVQTGEKLGPKVLKAIENGKILIPIISKNYASSKSCLDQLVRMMERQKHSGRCVVFPIFYKVKPADVRERRGSFGEAFRCYSQSFNQDDVVVEWKNALEEVSKLTTGWESEKVGDGREEELVKLVVERVSQELKRQYLDDTDYLVGIKSHVDEVMKLIDESSGDILCVGIYGMAGIGKTTLVKAIRKKLSGSFERRSFIENIRESRNRNRFGNLVNQLIADMLGSKGFQPSDLDLGIMTLPVAFRDRKALIILDDVDNIDQLNALAGGSHLLAAGSRIFFTTRNGSVLDGASVNCKYKLEEMNEEQRLILFSRHAFRRDSPPDEFSALARTVVSMTGGLPLALNGVGSFLCRKPAEVWRETIKKMENIPKSMRHLQILEALDIDRSSITKQPDGIARLNL